MPRMISVELLIIAGIGMVLGLLGPFGTYPMPLALRLSYWVGFTVAGYLIFRPITHAARWLQEMSNLPGILTLGLAVAVASLPLAFLVGYAINGMQFSGPMLGELFGILYLQCAGIGFAVTALMQQIFPRDGIPSGVHTGAVKSAPTGNEILSSPQEHAPVATEQRVRLLERLPPGFPSEILALSVEDHYVRVHADRRSEMLLMRLGDAIAEMDGIDGTQVHRSWWVATASVAHAIRRERNWRLVLKNGLEVPVARSQVAKLRKMGWIR